MNKTLDDWTKIVDGHINVPDELDPLINKVGIQMRMHRISGKNESLTICHIVYHAQKFFFKMYGKMTVEERHKAFTQGAEAQKIICAEHAALKAEFYGEGPIKFYKGYIVDKKSILNAPTAQPKAE